MKLYASPVATPDGIVFYCYTGNPKLFDEPHQTRAFSEAEAKRIVAIMETGVCGFSVVTQRWTEHLQEDHSIIGVNNVKPEPKTAQNAKQHIIPQSLLSEYEFLMELSKTLAAKKK